MKQELQEGLQSLVVGDLKLNLKTSSRTFKPNTTSNILAEYASRDIKEGCVVLDLGCGIAPLSIFAAKKGARMVYAVDLEEEACELARENARLNNVDYKIRILCGDLFEPVKGIMFDLIIDDVSGIAEEIALKSSWYNKHIPLGGADGIEPTIRMLDRVKEYLKEDGILYFPVLSLARSERIIEKAVEVFGEIGKNKLEVILDKNIVFNDELKENRGLIDVLKERKLVSERPYIQKGSRYLWNVRVFRANS